MNDYEKMRKIELLMTESQKLIDEAVRLNDELHDQNEIMLSAFDMFLEKYLGSFVIGFLLGIGLTYWRFAA